MPYLTRWHNNFLIIIKSKAMADDKNKNTSEDRERINVNEKYELQKWTSKFGCTSEELRDAVTKVGPMANRVADFLRNRK